MVTRLRQVFPRPAPNHLRLVLDDTAQVAAAVGVADTGDATEAAVRVTGGAVVARAEGAGAAFAVAGTDATWEAPSEGTTT